LSLARTDFRNRGQELPRFPPFQGGLSDAAVAVLALISSGVGTRTPERGDEFKSLLRPHNDLSPARDPV